MNRAIHTVHRQATRPRVTGALRRALTAALMGIVPSVAAACPACYGGATGPVIDGMNAAVLVMIGITGGVFSWIVAFALRIARREAIDDLPASNGSADADGSGPR